MAKKQDRALSRLAGIAILLVVLGHADPLASSSSSAQIVFRYVSEWIYTFHMPLFFFMAGYSFLKFTAKRRQTFPRFAWTKATRLLLPFVALTSIASLFKAILSRLALHPRNISVSEIALQLVFPWTNVVVYYWFLPTLFIALSVCHFMARSEQRNVLLWAMTGISLILFCAFHNRNLTGWPSVFNLGGVAHNFIYIWLGVLASRFKMSEFVVKYGLFLLPISIILYCILPTHTDRSLWSFVLAVAGTGGAWSFAHRFESALIGLVGDYSYSIYLLSWFFQTTWRVIVHDELHLNPWVALLGSIVLSVVGTLVLARALKSLNLPLIQRVCGLDPAPRGREAVSRGNEGLIPQCDKA